jgi:hypothetical protein
MSDELTLVPLTVMTAELRAPLMVGELEPGARWIWEVESGAVEGERLTGVMKGQANGDWMTLGPGGIATLDVRALIETHDGALVFVQYLGRTDISQGGAAPIYTAPRFETADERYTWLNGVQAAAKGYVAGSSLRYEIFELR